MKSEPLHVPGSARLLNDNRDSLAVAERPATIYIRSLYKPAAPPLGMLATVVQVPAAPMVVGTQLPPLLTEPGSATIQALLLYCTIAVPRNPVVICTHEPEPR